MPGGVQKAAAVAFGIGLPVAVFFVQGEISIAAVVVGAFVGFGIWWFRWWDFVVSRILDFVVSFVRG